MRLSNNSNNHLLADHQALQAAMDQAKQKQLLLRALMLQQQQSSATANAIRALPGTSTAVMHQILHQQGRQQIAQLISASEVARQQQRQQAPFIAAAAANIASGSPMTGSAFASSRDFLLQRLSQQLGSSPTFSSMSTGSARVGSLSPLPGAFRSSATTALSDIYGLNGVFRSSNMNLTTSSAMLSNPDTDILTGEPLTDSKSRKGKKKPKDHPRRPLSAYNIFFKEERQRILNDIPDASAAEKTELDGAKLAAATTRKRKKNPHGKIGFESLAKAIGQRWQELKRDEVQHYKAQADVDKKRYQDEMGVYNAAKLRALVGGDDVDKTSVSSESDEGNNDAGSASTVHTHKKFKTAH